MSRYTRPALFLVSLAVAATCFYSFFTTPMPAADALPTHAPSSPYVIVKTMVAIWTVPVEHDIPVPVYQTRIVHVTPTLGAYELTAAAMVSTPHVVVYTPPPPTAATDCFWSPGREYCTWTTPIPAPTNAPLESYP